jgi:DNA-binding beta-propeller fold protein YncE
MLSADARPGVRDQAAALGRTEDIKLSPGRNRLAIAEFEDNRISLFDISVTRKNGHPQVVLTGHLSLGSPGFAYPHGISFIDDETAVIANREGVVTIINLPASGKSGQVQSVAPMAALSSSRLSKLLSPGSVVVYERKPGIHQLLVGNNYIHRVTSHRVDMRKGIRFGGHRVLLERDLNIPDGLCLSSDRKWLAVSNHSSQEVFIYDYTRRLGRFARPGARLQGVAYPHGLKFTRDGHYLLVADAGAPLVHVFKNPGTSWKGTLQPIHSVRVMDQGTFELGHCNEKEGGPKGLEFDEEWNLLMTTCAHQPLAFFSLSDFLQK